MEYHVIEIGHEIISKTFSSTDSSGAVSYELPVKKISQESVARSADGSPYVLQVPC